MKATATKHVNVRVGKPSVNAPCFAFLEPGSVIDVEDRLYLGDNFEGLDTWVKDFAGNFYWSGGFSLDTSLTGKLPWWISEFGISELWEATKGEGVTVFLLDSGIINTPDLSPEKIIKLSVLGDDGRDTLGHGTLMASIIAGRGKSITGVAPEVTLVSIKICDRIPNARNYLAALQKVSEIVEKNPSGHYVVNTSLRLGNTAGHDKGIIAEIDRLTRRNVIVCCAVGNEQRSSPPWPRAFPASLTSVVSVAGLERLESGKYTRHNRSNYWTDITVTAPGVYATDSLSDRFGTLSPKGSSHACAYISGLSALFQSKVKQNGGGSSLNSEHMRNLLSQCTAVGLQPQSNIIDQEKLIATFNRNVI